MGGGRACPGGREGGGSWKAGGDGALPRGVPRSGAGAAPHPASEASPPAPPCGLPGAEVPGPGGPAGDDGAPGAHESPRRPRLRGRSPGPGPTEAPPRRPRAPRKDPKNGTSRRPGRAEAARGAPGPRRGGARGGALLPRSPAVRVTRASLALTPGGPLRSQGLGFPLRGGARAGPDAGRVPPGGSPASRLDAPLRPRPTFAASQSGPRRRRASRLPGRRGSGHPRRTAVAGATRAVGGTPGPQPPSAPRAGKGPRDTVLGSSPERNRRLFLLPEKPNSLGEPGVCGSRLRADLGPVPAGATRPPRAPVPSASPRPPQLRGFLLSPGSAALPAPARVPRAFVPRVPPAPRPLLPPRPRRSPEPGPCCPPGRRWTFPLGPLPGARSLPSSLCPPSPPSPPSRLRPQGEAPSRRQGLPVGFGPGTPGFVPRARSPSSRARLRAGVPVSRVAGGGSARSVSAPRAAPAPPRPASRRSHPRPRCGAPCLPVSSHRRPRIPLCLCLLAPLFTYLGACSVSCPLRPAPPAPPGAPSCPHPVPLGARAPALPRSRPPPSLPPLSPAPSLASDDSAASFVGSAANRGR
uniref:basic proline-rich protein-like n=1 Tax=Nyctereutes procyonoides TaxID=34880 RepID=UPI0024448163|nr:basic proline-rich protein-like [Nyctereutes procyonoides]